MVAPGEPLVIVAGADTRIIDTRTVATLPATANTTIKSTDLKSHPGRQIRRRFESKAQAASVASGADTVAQHKAQETKYQRSNK